MFWIALAAQLSAPLPIGPRFPDVRALFTADDYPRYLQLEGKSAVVYTRTTVRPDGSTEGCLPEISSGDKKLDAYTCALIVKRARFEPARWTDGTPAYGVIRVPVSYRIVDSPMTDADLAQFIVPDIDLAVNRLPKGGGAIVSLTLEIAMDAEGRTVACHEQRASIMHNKKQFPELVAIACQKATAEFTGVPPVDAAGKPARSIQTVGVRFSKSR